jgi:hypothetical protein
MILTVLLVLVPSSPGLRPGLRDAETPFTAITIHFGESCLCVFCQKPAFYWQNEGFWRSQAEVSGSNVKSVNANVEPADARIEPLNPNVGVVDADVEPLSPDIGSANGRDELGNANLQSANTNDQPANPKV